MDKPKTLLGFPIKYTDDLLPIKDGDIKFGRLLIAKKVRFIGGPLDGRVIVLDEVATKVIIRKSEIGEDDKNIEYKIKQDEKGEWFGLENKK